MVKWRNPLGFALASPLVEGEVLMPPCSFASRTRHRARVVEGGEADGELEGGLVVLGGG